MTMLPSVFGHDIFDNWMEPFERDFFGGRNFVGGKREKNLMKTDIKENDSAYEIDIDLPGFKKEEVSLKLDGGYLTVSAEKTAEENDEQKQGYLHRERWYGSCSRSFYLGEGTKPEDIRARMSDGILHMELPKKAPELPASSSIAIE